MTRSRRGDMVNDHGEEALLESDADNVILYASRAVDEMLTELRADYHADERNETAHFWAAVACFARAQRALWIYHRKFRNPRRWFELYRPQLPASASEPGYQRVIDKFIDVSSYYNVVDRVEAAVAATAIGSAALDAVAWEIGLGMTRLPPQRVNCRIT